MQTFKHLVKLACLAALSLALPQAAARAACDAKRFPVAVDIGHTPEQPGAMSARGIPEFAFNMALGRDAVAALEQAGFPAQRIVVAGAGREQLARRVTAANAMSPALVISIHHDSVQEKYLRDWQFAGEARKYADTFSGFSLFVSRASPHFAESLAFARALGGSLYETGLRHSPHHAEKIAGENRETLDAEHGVFEFRNLRILKESDAPAVLLEAGIIVNRAEELELASPERRTRVATAIVAAVTAMCERRSTALVLR